MKRKSWNLVGALLLAALASGCVRNPNEPTGGGNGNGNGNGSGNGNGNTVNLTVTLVVGGNVPGSGTGTGTTAGCNDIAEIGGELHGSGGVRTAEIARGSVQLLNFTPKDKNGQLRGGTCDINTPVSYEVTQPAGSGACELLPNASNPYTPSVRGVAPGKCTIKAVAAGVRTSDDKDVEITVK